MTKYGYVRIYENSNSIDSQKDELRKYINDDRFIIADTINGKYLPGYEYVNLKKVIKKGDELYIKSYFSIGDNTKQIKNELIEFRKKEIIVKILDIPSTLINYSKFNEMQKLVSDLVADIIIDNLQHIEEQEKYNKDKRRKAGIERSRKKGINGRPKHKYKPEWNDIFKKVMKKEITNIKAMELMGIKRTKYFEFKKEYIENHT
ncbi:MAG: recombinase family protein [Methanobacteriaceae archaeon]|nr:recombinase family protein [Methanobacteriaceae archaeon]